MPRVWTPRDGPLAKSGKVKNKVTKANKKRKQKKMSGKQSFTVTHDDMEVLALSTTPEELTGRRERLEARLQEMDQEISLSAVPTTEQVEQYQRENNVEDFGSALRQIISEQDIKRTAFAQPEPGMSETDRENELKRLINERMDADKENYIND